MLSTSILPTLAPSLASSDQGSGSPQQGSNAAYKLLNNQYVEAALFGAGIVLGGAVITYVGCKLAYGKYCDYKEGKFLEEIKEINKFHNETLIQIPLYGKKTQVSLPPVFSLSEEKKSVDAIHFTDEVLRQKGRTLPRGTPMALSKYQRHIFNAINLLQSFYFSVQVHKSGSKKNADVREENGVVRAIISYLIEMLDSHCLKFEGYDYDIGILEGLYAFISKYMSKGDSDKSRDYSRLSGVMTEIKRAQRHLEIHKEMLSLQEIVSDLHDDCRDEANELIRLFAILTNKNEHRDIISHILLETLVDGKLKYSYTKQTSALGINLWTSHESAIEILDSPFKNCLIQLSKLALKVIDVNKLNENDFPKIDIIIPDVDKLLEIKNKDKKSGLDESTKKVIQKQLKEISETFAVCNNFVTKKLHIDEHGLKTFVPIKNKEEDYNLMVERTKTFHSIATLIRNILILQHYSRKLNKGLELLGEIYITDTNKMNIFDSINDTFTKILARIKDIKTNFKTIDNSNKDHPDLECERVVRQKIDNYLVMTEASIVTSKDRITKYWDKNKDLSEELKAIAKLDLIEATELMDKTTSTLLPDSINSGSRSKTTANSSRMIPLRDSTTSCSTIESDTSNMNTSYNKKNTSADLTSQSVSDASETDKQKRSFTSGMNKKARRVSDSLSTKSFSSPKSRQDKQPDTANESASENEMPIRHETKTEIKNNSINLENNVINLDMPDHQDKTVLCNFIVKVIDSLDDIERKKNIINYFCPNDKLLATHGITRSLLMAEAARAVSPELIGDNREEEKSGKINVIKSLIDERKKLYNKITSDSAFKNHLDRINEFSDQMIIVDDLRDNDNKTLLYRVIEGLIGTPSSLYSETAGSIVINTFMEYLLDNGASLVSQNGSMDFNVISENGNSVNCTYLLRKKDAQQRELRYYRHYDSQLPEHNFQIINIDEIPGLRTYLNSTQEIDFQKCGELIKPWHEQRNLRTPLFHAAETIGFSQDNRLCFYLMDRAQSEIVSQPTGHPILDDFSDEFIERIKLHLARYLGIIKQRQWYNKLNPARATELALIYQAVINGVKTCNYEEMLVRLWKINKQAVAKTYSDLYTDLEGLINEAIDWKNERISLFTQACYSMGGSEKGSQGMKESDQIDMPKNDMKNDDEKEIRKIIELESVNEKLLQELNIYRLKFGCVINASEINASEKTTTQLNDLEEKKNNLETDKKELHRELEKNEGTEKINTSEKKKELPKPPQRTHMSEEAAQTRHKTSNKLLSRGKGAVVHSLGVFSQNPEERNEKSLSAKEKKSHNRRHSSGNFQG